MHLNNQDSNEDLSYKQTLRNIAFLRGKGYADTDPKLVKQRAKLKDILDRRKKSKKKGKKVVPNLLGYKTVALANVEKPESKDTGKQQKYMLVGSALGLAGVAYYFYKRFTS